MTITFRGTPVTLKGKQLQVQDEMQNFTVYKNDLSPLQLKDLQQAKVILSIPSIDTGVCAIEVAKFMEKMKEFPEVACISVSLDLPFALDRWCQAKGNAQVTTTSDYKTHAFAQVSGTYIEELGLLTRAVFVVDENQIVQHVEYVSEVSQEPDYDQVFATLQKLLKK